jgi:hypothetical protein
MVPLVIWSYSDHAGPSVHGVRESRDLSEDVRLDVPDRSGSRVIGLDSRYFLALRGDRLRLA